MDDRAVSVVKFPRACLVFSCVVLCACAISRPVPPIPNVDVSRFQNEVAKSINQATAEAKASPNDPDPTLRLCMILHAHEQYQAAGQCYARVNALAPKRFDALYCWGHAQASEGAYAAAA